MTHTALGIDPCDDRNHAIFNAALQKRSAVDPRTGLFEVFVPLLSITGNAGQGPVIDMSLYYSPMVNNRAALGDGWSFAITVYNETTGMLTLHSGEVLAVKAATHAYAPGVSVVWKDNNKKIEVTRKDGRVELLAKVGNSKVYAPATLTDGKGNSLTLTWKTGATDDTTKQMQICLQKIRDTKNTLVQLEYTDTQVTVTFWPGKDVQLVYTLTLEEFALKEVGAPEGTKSVFEYLDHAQCGWVLNKAVNFEGLVETVIYKDNGLTFEDNTKLSALPCVSEHTLQPCGKQPPVKTAYEYERTDKNNYKTIVKHGDPAVRTVIYEYDNKHEMVKETATQKDCILIKTNKWTSSDYTASTTWQKGSKSQTETRKMGFDATGNIVYHYQKGLLRWWIDFKNGLAPHVENHISTFNKEYNNFHSFYSELTTLIEKIETIPCLNMHYRSCFELAFTTQNGINRLISVKITGATAGETDILTFNKDNIERLSTFRANDPENEEGARVSWFNRSHEKLYSDQRNPVENSGHSTALTTTASESAVISKRVEFETLFSSRSLFPVSSDIHYLHLAEMLADNRKHESGMQYRLSSETSHPLCGRLINQVDEQGNTTTYEYDNFGRLTKMTRSAGTAYAQVTQYAYFLTDDGPRLEITEANGRMRASEYDGQDNLLKEFVAEPVIDKAKPDWRQVLQVDYDTLGRKLCTTHYDYLANGTQVSEWEQVQYDDWNEACGTTNSHGQSTFNLYDPISRERRQWTGKADDKHGETIGYNESGAVTWRKQTDASGTPVKQQDYTYNAAGLVEQITEGERVTCYTYDSFGRVLTEAFNEPDNDIKTYTYTYTYTNSPEIEEPLSTSITFNNKTYVLASRTFDSWGRLTSFTRGGATETYTYEGANRAPVSKKLADDTELNYTYIPELDNAVQSVSSGANKKAFTYAYGVQANSSAGEGESVLTFSHDLYERVKTQRTDIKKGEGAQAALTHSPAGRPLSGTDAFGKACTYSYDTQGRRNKTTHADVTTTHSYSATGQLDKEVLTITGQPTQPEVAYAYDTLGRETSRTFKVGDKTFVVASSYNDDNKLNRCELKQGATILGARAFTYTANGYLKKCDTSGVWQPTNPSGKHISCQAFEYDPLGNITACVTTFEGGSCTTTYSYDTNTGCQLTKVTHSDKGYAKTHDVTYDKAGRTTKDYMGVTYAYDWLGRLARAGSRLYTYDAMDRQLTVGSETEKRQLVYDNNGLRGESASADKRYLCPGSAGCTVQKAVKAGVARTLLELRDASDTVILCMDLTADTVTHLAYQAYGATAPNADPLFGFAGSHRAEGDSQIALGAGYRYLDPQTGRFNVPDSLSPFGAGGPNPYAYAAGDPVNNQDPTGHFNVSKALYNHYERHGYPGQIGLGKKGALFSTIIWAGLGVLTAIATGGASLIATCIAVGLAAAAAATAIAAVVIQDSDPETAAILGWVSFGLTIATGAYQLLKKTGELAIKLMRSGRKVVNSMLSRLQTGLTRLAQPKHARYQISGRDYRIKMLEIQQGNRLGQYSVQPLLPQSNSNGLLQMSLVDKLKEPTALSEIRMAVTQYWQSLSFADLSTVVCTVSGALGNAGGFETQQAQFTNNSINQATSLTWGTFNLGRYKIK